MSADTQENGAHDAALAALGVDRKEHAERVARLVTNAKWKCDASGCGSRAEVTDRFGGRFCKGHSYLAGKERDGD